MGGTGPLTIQNNFYSRGYTFGFLRNTSTFIQIIKNLDIIKNIYIYTDFNFSKNFCQFYIYNIPQDIHYEILNSGNIFKVCLHIENKQFISKHLISLFEEIQQNINQIINGAILDKANFLKLEIPSSEKLINFTMNILVQETIEKILYHFTTKK